MSPTKTVAAAVLFGAGTSLGGCAPTETDLLTSAYVERDYFPPGPPVFCYRTLAEVDCYRTPQAAEAGRLVASDPAFE